MRDGTPTAPGDTVAALRPIGRVDTSKRLQHTIAFFDEAPPPAAPTPSASWVRNLGQDRRPGPIDVGQCAFVALDTASPYVVDYESANATNKTAHYMLRWVTKGGDKGPWSKTVSATIGG